MQYYIICQNFKMCTPLWALAVSFPDLSSYTRTCQNKGHTSIVTALLVVTAEDQKQPKCPSRDNRLNKSWYTHKEGRKWMSREDSLSPLCLFVLLNFVPCLYSLLKYIFQSSVPIIVSIYQIFYFLYSKISNQ